MKSIATYTRLYWVIAIFSLPSCNFNKAQPDEMVSLTDEVLKKGEGVEIDVKPLPKEKK